MSSKATIFLFLMCWGNGLFSQQVITGSFMETPLSIHFVDENTGYAGGANILWGHGEIKKTTNGGVNWITIFSTPYAVFSHFWFFDKDNILVTEGGVLYRTTNNGINWFSILVPAQAALTGICFANNNTGYMSGDGFFNPAFLKTTDGGYNWRNIQLDTNLDLGDVDFINENTGYTVGNRIIIKTTDGGSTLKQSIFSYYYLFSVDAIDSATAFAAGYVTNSGYCLIIKTEDSGNNWFINYNNTVSNLNKIEFITNDLGFSVGGGGVILKTTNGGDLWKEQRLIDTAEFYDFYFINENTGWLIGQIYPGGLLYKTTNSGENWILQNTLTERPTEFSLLQNYPNPFNPKTKIRYKLGNPSEVLLKVYDIAGKEIKTLVEGTYESGVYETEFDGSGLSSGVYFYKIDVKTLNTIVINRFSESRKMVIVK